MIEPGMDEISHSIMIKASKKKKKKKNIFDPQTKRKKEISRGQRNYICATSSSPKGNTSPQGKKNDSTSVSPRPKHDKERNPLLCSRVAGWQSLETLATRREFYYSLPLPLVLSRLEFIARRTIPGSVFVVR